ncbi:uncharacterized protein wu:fj16a03 [Thalassophryne amazonica]|uniref:uncharacterized protein wu:fj16a03 n=1 Tax=Thalassophryne amazonica TaxID=390379 RepID=UPI0014710920|nr:uncharacterized protein wu:fj16a03 [Thalassophryne amazonica]
MKTFLLLLCSGLIFCSQPEGQFYIECYGKDFLMLNNQVLQCRSEVKQACYTKESGEKGCIRQDFCQKDNWTCCNTNLCNA